MEEMTTIVDMPEPIVNATDKTDLSFKAEDFAADIEKLKNTMTVDKPTASAPITPPTTPTQPEPEVKVEAVVTKQDEATKIEVPEKFKTADGSVDTEKLSKSITNVDEALASYLAKEKELKRKMNEVKAKENAYINPPIDIAPTPNIPINQSFAQQLEQDIAKDGAGVVLAKLFTAAQESVEERVKTEIEQLKSVNAQNTTKQQIEAIGKTDPWVYTPEGMATLTRVLEEQPYLWQAPDPYKAAYMQYNGLKNVASKSVPQVLTPTPTARPSAPVPTGQAAVQTSAQVLKLDTKQDVDNYLKKLTPAQQSEFFKKAGFPGF